MYMKKVFTIIISLILVVAVVTVIAWLFSRNKAVKEGGTAPSFRSFLTRNATTQPPREPTTPELGEETPTNEPEEPTDQTPDGSSFDSVQISQFTSSPMTPTQGQGTGFGGTMGTGTFGGTRPPGTPSSLPGASTITTPPPIAAPACRDEDININFTAEEIRRLGELQNQFNAIAATLHTDADVQAELSNYTIFRTKADQVTELYNYCLAVSPRIADATLKTRIPTPFWRGTGDVRGYLIKHPLTRDVFSGTIDPRNHNLAKGAFERIFKLNLW